MHTPSTNWNRFLVPTPPTLTPAGGTPSSSSGLSSGIHTGRSFDPCVFCGR